MNYKQVRGIMVLFLMLAVLVCSIDYGTTTAQAQENVSNDTISSENQGTEEEEDSEMIETEDMDCEEETFDEVEESKRIEVHIEITARWENHYNADVTITNLSDTRIDDWEISFSFQNKIEHIWNARISEEDKENSRYTVKNADWNQDIEKNEFVTFGMTVYYEDEMDEVSDYYLTRVCLEADVDYDINYKEYSRWDNKVNGEIVITNLSDRKIEDGNLGLQVIYCLSRFGMLNILMMRQKMFWKIWDITKTWNRGSPFPLDL